MKNPLFTMGSTGKSRIIKPHWICKLCHKSLSSKRSFDEHVNIHTKSRPFTCDECNYAAASQMTLRRHKLRNHVPRSDWGYQCPYCGEQYMEPASYQQHIIARHWGCSATFGCPYVECRFTTKSSRFFREHLCKHQAVIRSHSISRSRFIDGATSLNFDDIAVYLINDECGVGNSNIKRQHRFIPIKQQLNASKCYKPRLLNDFQTSSIARIKVEELLAEEEIEKSDKIANLTHEADFSSSASYYSSGLNANVDETTTHTSTFTNMNESMTTIDWIETEVVIDEDINTLSHLQNGQIDDFELD